MSVYSGAEAPVRPARGDPPQTAAASGEPRRNPAAQAGATDDIGTFWHGRSLRAQLLIILLAIQLLAGLVAGLVTILKARTSTRVEIAASMRLAEVLVNDTIPLMEASTPRDRFLSELPLQFRIFRHVRISVRDVDGQVVEARPRAPEPAQTEERAPAPAWFAALIASPVETREIPILFQAQRIGSVIISGEPADEIAEVWENTVALGSVAAVVNLLILAVLYVLFGRVLDPISRLGRGLLDLERQNYKVRLSRPDAREFAALADHFNALACALEGARADNARLHQRLIAAQDDERRRTARELHDEVGPCLFGLRANATSIANLAHEHAPAAKGIEERAGDMLGIIDHLQGINRTLLNRLRPMALGHVPLGELIAQMIAERARQSADVSLSFSAEGLAAGYGESIDLTLYRCVQEGVTNAMRHANAKTIEVHLATTPVRAGDEEAARQLDLTVRDDGRGFDVTAPMGRGLLGMRERVHALGGDCNIESVAGGGTIVHFTIPVPGTAHASYLSATQVGGSA